MPGRTFIGLIVVLVALLRAAAPAAAQDQQASDQPVPLVELRFDGLSRYDYDQIVRLTGLEIGQMVTQAQLTNMAQQLADTGLFTGIRYQYTTTGKGLSARFIVREAQWTVPVIFDNFIGIPDDELIADVARYVPGFDGTAVEGGAANNLIGTALQRVLAERGLPGRVVVIPQVNIEENWTRYAFAVIETGRDMSVCAIDTPGVSSNHAREIERLLSGVIGERYSKAQLLRLRDGSVLNYYRRRGYWGASLGEIDAALDAGCRGVTVTLPVNEGIAYRVAGVRWTGNRALPDVALDKAMALKPGVVASLVDVQDGLLRVRREYERLGHILVSHTLDQELDDAGGRVTFVVTLDEGPQLRMGRFEVEGLPPDVAADLVARWELPEGAVFDGTYVDRYMTTNRLRIQRDDGPIMTIEVTVERTAGLAHVKLLPAR
jgi:outer membrane protein assembly factor BamA